MIRLVLLGGLGNQMFQYAAAKALAKRLDTDIVLDLYGLLKNTKKGTLRKYGLDVFDLNLKTKTSLKGEICIKLRPWILKNRKLFTQFCFSDSWAIKYDERFEILKDGACLCGYFQNSKYYNSIATELRADFRFKFPLEAQNQELVETIQSGNSIAIHIRRGDYVSNKNAQNNFANCTLQYYKSALKYMQDKVDNPHFYLFSDDPKWAVETLNIKDSVRAVDWNSTDNSYLDMQLMSLCKHNIIANSTFSWWGAWLNANPDKIVIAPSQWYSSEQKNDLLGEFYPESWIRLDL